MTVWHSPAEHYLVGDFSWLEGNRVFWFAANGDAGADAHVLDFDDVILDDDGLHFFLEGRRVAVLESIGRARVEDPDDFRIAWQIWQQVAPLRRPLIARMRQAYERCDNPSARLGERNAPLGGRASESGAERERG